MFKYILFDLDGTLTDSSKGIINCVKYAMDAAGVTIENDDDLFEFIGPPLTDGFMTILGMNREEAERATTKFRERYNVTGLFENEPYEGIKEVLETLSERGFVLAVATSKPEVFAKQILEHFDLASYFEFVGGADLEETRVGKGDVIQYVLDTCGLSDKKEKILMIGDREHDVLGAREQGLECVGVLFGYGDRKEMEDCHAAYIAESINELRKMLLS